MTRPLRVLLVEDSADDALLLARELRRGGYALQMTRVETADDMHAALTDQTWDVVIADYNLPHFSALAALQIVRQTGLDLPFLIASGAVGEEMAVDALRAGARDFILKDRLSRLLPAIERELGEAEERARRREAEARYRELFTQMQNGFALHEILTDEHGHPNDYRFLTVNPAFERITGLAAADIVGKTVRAVLPGIEASWIERYGKVAQTGQATQFEQYDRVLHKYFQVAAFCPQPGRFAVLVTDTTPLREAEAARSAEAERFRHLIEHGVDIVTVISRTGETLYVSPSVERVLGLPPSRTIGASIFRRVHEDDFAHVSAAFERSLANPGQLQHTICRYRHNDGSWRMLETSIRSLLHLPAVGGVVLNVRDVTESYEAREHLRREVARTQALLRTSGRLNAQINLETVLKTVCEEAVQALAVPAATISLFDDERQVFYLAAATGLPPAYTRHHRPISAATWQSLGAVQPITIHPDVQAVERSVNADLYAHFGIRTMVAAYMGRGQEVIGYLHVLTIGASRQFSDDELDLLRGLADQAGNAIANARLYAQANLRLDRLHALHIIDDSIISQHRLVDSLATVVEQVALQLRVDAAAVLLYDADRELLEYAAGVGFHGDAIRTSALPLGVGLAGRAARERRTESRHITGDTPESPRAALWQAEGFVIHYSVPLVAQSHLLGVLEVFNRSPLEPNAEWLKFLEALAVQTAIAIDRAALLTRTQEQARQLAQILRTVPEGVALLDASARILMVNPEGERFLAFLAGASTGDVITDLGGLPAFRFLSRAPQPRLPQEIVLPADDTAFEIAAEPLQDAGVIQGWVLLVRDVTEARRRRQNLAQQDRLAAVGQLAAGIAHDFNNILTPIRLCVDLSLDATQPNTLLRTNLDQIRTATDRASGLVAQILAFSRRETQTRPTPIRLQSVVKEAVQLVRSGLSPHIEIRTAIDADAGMVLAVPGQVHQIVLNLCTNAFHAMRETGGILSIALEDVDLRNSLPTAGGELDPGAYVRLTVRDTGRGMDTATLSRIFEPFFTTKRPGEGTGMGLSVVFGIVNESGGGIHVESAPGQGAAFSIYLPRVATQASPAPPPARAALRGTERILVVDDEAPILSALFTLLTQLGYHVLTAGSGHEALALLAQPTMRVDLVMTDFIMPDMSGLELAQALTAHGNKLPVILMSGHREPVETAAFHNAGIRSFLTKPFNAQSVGEAIRNALV